MLHIAPAAWHILQAHHTHSAVLSCLIHCSVQLAPARVLLKHKHVLRNNTLLMWQLCSAHMRCFAQQHPALYSVCTVGNWTCVLKCYSHCSLQVVHCMSERVSVWCCAYKQPGFCIACKNGAWWCYRRTVTAAATCVAAVLCECMQYCAQRYMHGWHLQFVLLSGATCACCITDCMCKDCA